jgi:hypothetical protein
MISTAGIFAITGLWLVLGLVYVYLTEYRRTAVQPLANNSSTVPLVNIPVPQQLPSPSAQLPPRGAFPPRNPAPVNNLIFSIIHSHS